METPGQVGAGFTETLDSVRQERRRKGQRASWVAASGLSGAVRKRHTTLALEQNEPPRSTDKHARPAQLTHTPAQLTQHARARPADDIAPLARPADNLAPRGCLVCCLRPTQLGPPCSRSSARYMRAFPSFAWPVLTEIYLCQACLCLFRDNLFVSLFRATSSFISCN
jgi:hypothetical protein